MITLLLSAVSQVQRAWETSDGQKVRRETARAVLGVMTRDLQNALAPLPGTSTNAVCFSLNPGTASAAYGDVLYWTTSVSGDRGKSDVTMVGYFVNPDTKSFCRFSTNAPAGLSLADAVSAGSALRPAAGNDFKGHLADGVMGMFVTLFDEDGNRVNTGQVQEYFAHPPAAAEIALVMADARAAKRFYLTNSTGITGTNDLTEDMQVFRTRVDIPAGK